MLGMLEVGARQIDIRARQLQAREHRPARHVVTVGAPGLGVIGQLERTSGVALAQVPSQ
ncbi:MAG: hypothetical protein H7306_03965, partial [Bacteriovorax sp.]|nr:hypothetical protein [Rhizobacter sp.]